MITSTYNFNLYQGNDDIYVLKVESIDNSGNAANADLSGYNFVLSIKDNTLADTTIQLSTINNDISLGILDNSGNFIETSRYPYAIKIHFNHDLTEKLMQPKYVYDMFAIISSGIRELFLKGEIRVERGITYGTSSSRHY